MQHRFSTACVIGCVFAVRAAAAVLLWVDVLES